MNRTEIDREALVRKAIEARTHAYAPYSNYRVGAAVQMEDGEIYTGANVENAVYPLCICAERSAVASAVSTGARRIAAIAVATRNAGSPCGSCRQVIREFAEPETPVLITDLEGRYRERTVEELLPESFSVEDLEVAQDASLPK